MLYFTPLLRKQSIFLLLLLCTLGGCVTTARFDQYAYIQTTSIKVDALNVMDLATEDFSLHKDEVKQVVTTINKVYEYERNRKSNEITLKLWDKMRDTSGHLFMGFVERWKKNGKLRPVLIQESEKQVGEAFDVIAQFESKKITSKQAQ